MSDIIVLACVFVVTCGLAFCGRNKLAFFLCLVLISYNKFQFNGSGLFFMSFGANQSALMGLAAGYCTRRILSGKVALGQRQIPYARCLLWLLLSCVVSFSFYLFNGGSADISYFDYKTESTMVGFVLSQVFCFMVFIFTVMFVESIEDVMLYLTGFLISAMIFYIGWLEFGFSMNLPDFIAPVYSTSSFNTGYVYDRYPGLWADYELANEFAYIAGVISLVVLFSHAKKIQKAFALIVFSVSIPVAASTGTRSLLVMTLIFGGTTLLLYSLRRDIGAFRKISISAIVVLGTFVAVSVFMTDNTLQERVFKSIDSLPGALSLDFNETQKLANRNYIDTYEDILEIGGLFGAGPVMAWKVRGSDLVYHCLYYHIVIAFGLFGLLGFLAFWGKLMGDAVKRIMAKESVLVSVLLVALLVSLLADQTKINYWREPSHMCVYGFIYGLIGVFNVKRIAEKRMSIVWARRPAAMRPLIARVQDSAI
jgi:hypothetical protein